MGPRRKRRAVATRTPVVDEDEEPVAETVLAVSEEEEDPMLVEKAAEETAETIETLPSHSPSQSGSQSSPPPPPPPPLPLPHQELQQRQVDDGHNFEATVLQQFNLLNSRIDSLHALVERLLAMRSGDAPREAQVEEPLRESASSWDAAPPAPVMGHGASALSPPVSHQEEGAASMEDAPPPRSDGKRSRDAREDAYADEEDVVNTEFDHHEEIGSFVDTASVTSQTDACPVSPQDHASISSASSSVPPGDPDGGQSQPQQHGHHHSPVDSGYDGPQDGQPGSYAYSESENAQDRGKDVRKVYRPRSFSSAPRPCRYCTAEHRSDDCSFLIFRDRYKARLDNIVKS